jgi:hypothetical protein
VIKGTFDSSHDEMPRDYKAFIIVKDAPEATTYRTPGGMWSTNHNEADRFEDQTLAKARLDYLGDQEPNANIYMAPAPIIYVNAYEVSRHFGGPEEGGWYYDVGEPMASIPCMTEDEVERASIQIYENLGPTYQGRRTRFSVIGEENLKVVFESHPAEPWPKETPHYE